MTQATTTTNVRLVREVDGNDSEAFADGTHNRIYQTVDGKNYVTTSWSPDVAEFNQNVMAWPAEDEDGLPDFEYQIKALFGGNELPYVDGPNDDATHEAALAQHGYVVVNEEEQSA